jgi:hypothetical protein
MQRNSPLDFIVHRILFPFKFSPVNKTLIIILGAAIGIAGSLALRHILKKSPTPAIEQTDAAAKQKHDEEARRQIAWRIAGPRIEIAQEEVLKAAETRTQQVRDFFTERQKRIRAYADRVLSFPSKWKLGTSKLPGTDKDAHTRFLKEEFSKIIFSQSELEKQITGALEDYVRDIHAIENALLVKIRADLSDMPECANVLPDLKSEALFRDRFEKVIISLSEKTGADAKVDIGRMVGTEIAAAIAVRVGIAVASRLGISAAILGVGGAGGPETFGASVVAAVIIDQIAGWVIGWFYDPKLEIAKKLSEELGALSVLIVNGDEKTRGLKQELGTLAAQRKTLRENALREMILKPIQ